LPIEEKAMTNDPLFQIVLILIGVIAQIASTVVSTKWLKTTLIVVGAVTIVLAAAWVGSRAFSQPSLDTEPETIQITGEPGLDNLMFPRTLASYDFEEGLPSPWKIHPNHEAPVLSFGVESEQNLAYSGAQVLSLEVSFTEDVASTILRANVEEIDAGAVLAYIFIPESRRTAGVRFYASWQVGTYFGSMDEPGAEYFDCGDKTFESPEVFSDQFMLEPGKWNPVFVTAGTGYRERENDEHLLIWKKGFYALHLNLWSNKAYTGPIYIDRISVMGK
jgi:hypothetical protein